MFVPVFPVALFSYGATTRSMASPRVDSLVVGTGLRLQNAMYSPSNSFRWRFEASTVLSFDSAICNRDSQRRAPTSGNNDVPKDLMREDLSVGYPGLPRQLSTGNVRGSRGLRNRGTSPWSRETGQMRFAKFAKFRVRR